jgi:spore maturation protein CgeB
MRILLAGFGQFAPFAPAWSRALTQLGHEVVFLDFQEYLSHGFTGKVESRLLCGPGITRLNKAIIENAEKHRPEVVVIHNGNLISERTIEKVRRVTWVAGYQHDDPFGAFCQTRSFRNFRRTIPHYDSHHVIREVNIEDYRALGVTNVAVLRTYYVPWLHYPLEEVKKDIDVVFIGHAEKDDRLEYITYLLQRGVSLRVFGYDRYWRRYLARDVFDRLPPIKPACGEEYARTVLRSKICLAFYSTANRDDCAYRVFEIPACGGFLLARDTPLMRNLYEQGKEADFFDSPRDLYDKIQYYLKYEEQRQRIARQGRLRAVGSGYDVVSKMKQWINETSQFMQRGRS